VIKMKCSTDLLVIRTTMNLPKIIIKEYILFRDEFFKTPELILLFIALYIISAGLAAIGYLCQISSISCTELEGMLLLTIGLTLLVSLSFIFFIPLAIGFTCYRCYKRWPIKYTKPIIIRI
jgi:hypothetical protein